MLDNDSCSLLPRGTKPADRVTKEVYQTPFLTAGKQKPQMYFSFEMYSSMTEAAEMHNPDRRSAGTAETLIFGLFVASATPF